MRSRNSLISSDLPARDVLIIVRGMLGSAQTSVRGVVDGLKYLRNHHRQNGHEPQFHVLVELVCYEGNNIVKLSITEGNINERIIWICQQVRSLLISLITDNVMDSSSLIGLRCQSSFNLAEIHRHKRRFRSAVNLLRECENLLNRDTEDEPDVSGCPSLIVIRTCLAEMLLVVGDPVSGFDVSNQVVCVLRDRSELSDTEKLQAAYALFVFTKASVRIGRVADTIDQITQFVASLRQDLSNSSDGYLLCLLDRIDAELVPPPIRYAGGLPNQSSREVRSRGRSEPPGNLRTKQVAVESYTVYIPPEQHSVTSSCQTAEDESPLRSQSVPPTAGKKYIQSPSVATANDVEIHELSTSTTGAEDLQWVECTSRNSGKPYWYNTSTGESTWNKT